MNYQYYIVEGDGPVRQAIISFLNQHELFQKHANEVVKHFGASGCYVHSNGIAALSFNDGPPSGWLKVKKTGDGFRPPAKDKTACKYLYSVSRPSSFSLPASQVFSGDGRMYFPKFEKIGDVMVWIVPEGSKFDSTGCRSIKTSEYYLMKGN